MDNKEYSLQDIKDFMSYLCKKNKAYCIDRQNYILECVEEKQERDNMRCENCKQCLANKGELYCGLVYDCLENGEVESTDFCSYFEPKE